MFWILFVMSGVSSGVREHKVIGIYAIGAECWVARFFYFMSNVAVRYK